MNRSLVVYAAIAVALAALAGTILTLEDPIHSFVGADGTIHLSGKVTSAFLDYVQHGPRVSAVTQWLVPIGDFGKTTAWRVESFDTRATSQAIATPTIGRTPSFPEFVGYVLSPIREFLIWGMNFLTGTASAACTGGTCFYIGGAGNFSSTAHWSTTSGGASCTCTPGATDAIVFDASSGAGTATQDNATFTSGAVTMTNSSVTVTGSNNTWKVGGNWSDVNGHFAVSTSTIDFTANATVTTLPSTGDIQFYNVTVDASVTATVTTSVGIQNVMTVNGTWSQNTAGQTLYIRDDAGGGTPLVIGSSPGQINGATNTVTMYFFIQAGTITHIPGKAYPNVRLRFYPQPTVAGLGFEFRLDGFISAASLQFYGHAASPYFVNSQTYNVILTGDSNGDCIDDANIASTAYGITATSGLWTLTCTSGGINMTAASSSTFFIQFGSSSWVLDGPIALGIVTSTTNWSAGTGSFRLYTSSTTINPVFPAFSVAFSNNLTFNCNNAGSCVYTPATNAWKVSGTLTVSDPTNNSILTSNLNVTAGSVVIGTHGTLNQNSTTFTVSGWDSSAGNYNFGTGTIAFTGTGNIRTFGSTGSATMFRLTIASAANATIHSSGIGIKDSISITGTLTLDGAVYLRNESGTANPLVFVGTGTMTTTGIEKAFVFFDQAGTGTLIPPATYTRILLEFTPNVTVAGDGFEYRAIGNFTAATLLFAQRNGAPFFFNSQTFNVTLNGTSCMYDQPVGPATIGIKATSGTWSLTCPSGGVVFGSLLTTLYLQFGSSTWTIDGPWILNVSIDGTRWTVGTSNVTFNSGSAAITINPGLLAANQFNNLNITTHYAALNNEILGGNLIVAGLLHVYGNSGTSSATLDTALGHDYSVTVTTLQIDAYGHIQPRRSVVTILGSTWTTTNGIGEHSDCNAAFCFGGLSTVIFANPAGTTFTVSDPNSYSETYWNVQIAGGDALTLATDLLVLNQVTVGTNGGTGGTLHLTTRVLAMKGDVPQVLTIYGTSVFDNTTAAGGLAFNSVNGPELVPGYNYGAITLFFYASSNVFNPAGQNYQRLMGNVTTTGPCYVYSFFVAPSTRHFLDVNGQTLTCASLGLGTPPFGQASATPYIKAGSGTIVVNGSVTIGSTSPSAYIDFGSSTWRVRGNWTNSSTSTAWVTGTGTVVFDGAGTQTIASGGNPLPNVSLGTATAKNFTQSFSSLNFSSSVAVTVMFTAGITWTINQGVTGPFNAYINGGASAGVLTLRSSVSGSPWNIVPNAARTIATYVNVKDSNASSTIIACANTNTDAGNNVLWDFGCVQSQLVDLSINTFWLFLFIAIMVSLVIGAVRIREWRDG